MIRVLWLYAQPRVAGHPALPFFLMNYSQWQMSRSGPNVEIERVLSTPIADVVCHVRPARGLHASIASVLPHLGDWRPERLGEVRQWNVYVDGSSTDGSAAWGLAVIAHCRILPHMYVGSACGAASGTNNRAELHAACWAAYVACLLLWEASVTIHYDNLLVGVPSWVPTAFVRTLILPKLRRRWRGTADAAIT